MIITTPTNLLRAESVKRQIEQTLSKIGEIRRPTVKKFLNELAANDKSIYTQRNYASAIYTLEPFNKPYTELAKEDLAEWIAGMKSHHVDSIVSTYKVLVKRFIRWACNGGDEGAYPESVRWIKTDGKKKFRERMKEKKIMSDETLKQLVGAAISKRDKAMIFALYEGAFRAGEILGVKVKDVEIYAKYVVITVDGKTGKRRVSLVISAHDLREWFDEHPLKDNPEAPFWVVKEKDEIKPLSYEGLRGVIQRAQKRAGLEEIRIHPHLFRHTRITHTTSIFKEAEMKEYFGWTKDSDMASVYCHNTSMDAANTLFKHYGIRTEEEAKDPFTPKKCPNCGEDNSAVRRLCLRCGSALDVQTATKLDKLKPQSDELLTRVMDEFSKRAPEILHQILRETGLGQQITAVYAEATE